MAQNGLRRRTFLRRSLAAGAAIGASLGPGSLSPHLQAALAAPAVCGTLSDIEHVVILIQENRSFDHYFGSYRGVRGFADPTAPIQSNGLPVFYQPDPSNTTSPPVGQLLPFHLDSKTTNASCTHDITHDWLPQHQSWNNGAMDSFVTTHLAADPTYGNLTMGYYNRADIPFYYAVADAFTICDNYHASVIGPTDPNRLYTVSATVDPNGENGGPLLETLSGSQRKAFYGRFTWKTMPEQLEAAGISWKVYSPPSSDKELNPLAYFKAYQNPRSDLFQRAFVPSFPSTFESDASSGNLPQVSWVIEHLATTEHPPAPSEFGENTLKKLLDALTANPALWAKTVVFATYDENGGFFDHVPPPVPPPNTPGEYITAPPVPNPSVLGNPPVDGPIGLGFRVPMLILSPFSRGGLVSSDVFDHTSLLRFLETRFGVTVPNLSAWRRSAVGDMTSALNLAAPNRRVPRLPPAPLLDPSVIRQCLDSSLGSVPYPVPNPQQFPTQESGTAPSPSGPCASPTVRSRP